MAVINCTTTDIFIIEIFHQVRRRIGGEFLKLCTEIEIMSKKLYTDALKTAVLNVPHALLELLMVSPLRSHTTTMDRVNCRRKSFVGAENLKTIIQIWGMKEDIRSSFKNSKFK